MRKDNKNQPETLIKRCELVHIYFAHFICLIGKKHLIFYLLHLNSICAHHQHVVQQQNEIQLANVIKLLGGGGGGGGVIWDILLSQPNLCTMFK